MSNIQWPKKGLRKLDWRKWTYLFTLSAVLLTNNLFIALITEFPYIFFVSNVSGLKLTLLSRVLKRLHVCCVWLKGVDILTEVVVVFYVYEILPEIRHSLWKNDIWYRENVDVLLDFIRSKFIVASREKDGQCTFNVTSRRVRATIVALGKQ